MDEKTKAASSAAETMGTIAAAAIAALPAQNAHPTNRWFHRRLMTYIALAGLFILVVGAFTQDISVTQGSLLEAVAYILGAIVGAYVGVKTIAERLGKA